MRGLFLLFASVALACGSGAVTDPLRAGFEADPRPVLGEWQTSAVTPPGRFDALLERGAGRLSGYFEFALWGRWWVVRFANATWDGEAAGDAGGVDGEAGGDEGGGATGTDVEGAAGADVVPPHAATRRAIPPRMAKDRVADVRVISPLSHARSRCPRLPSQVVIMP